MKNRYLKICFLALAGVAAFGQNTPARPEAVLSYIPDSSGNQMAIGDGQVLPFTAASVGQTKSATLIIANRGTAAETLQAATVANENFRIAGLPLLPASIAVDRDIRFTVVFQPGSRAVFETPLRIELGSRTVVIRLRGEGIGPALVYELRNGEETSAVVPGGPVQIPTTAVDTLRTVQFRISNKGNAEARISTISLTGTGYQLAELPLLPVTVAAGESTGFQIRFNPRESGRILGQLRIDAAAFQIEGIGLGPQFTVMMNGAVIGETGIVFPGTPVGGESIVRVKVQNTGTAAGTIQGIGLTGVGYRLQGLPVLPRPLAVNEEFELALMFRPESLVVSTGTLQIDTRSIGVRGVAVPPPALPPITISGAGDGVEALQQPSLGVQLAEPYPLELTGRLTLTFQSDSLVDDPAIQFATGGRTIAFRVPANSREAVFAQSLTQVPFQSGTVAGTITVSASLQVATVEVTPAPSRSIQVLNSSPRIQKLQLGGSNDRGFELLVSGFSPSRSITELTFTFTPVAGAALQNTTLKIAAADAFDAWYQAVASRSFGSQFTAAVFLNVSGKLDNIQSVAVAATGPGGVSESRSINLR